MQIEGEVQHLLALLEAAGAIDVPDGMSVAGGTEAV
jgi:hypothetical protein